MLLITVIFILVYIMKIIFDIPYIINKEYFYIKGYDMALVTKIKEYREQAGYKQSELAELVGARRETIVHLENGRYNPSLKLAMDIAKVFHVTVEELFEFVEDEK